eukprot:CAMPEP_0185835128 /NCGR_PEP_ID=MMETSP1353-20130828/7108_1 /TAXON_ID=1077150 /ORGANISM="Erythrolobus australicus, Strain CCMP3124" /LENGTH=54 /DNA_ID=CAMNT_0028533703 /DNA_START=463 /DNA_END=627 /DNA_ORIENTATION=-
MLLGADFTGQVIRHAHCSAPSPGALLRKRVSRNVADQSALESPSPAAAVAVPSL